MESVRCSLCDKEESLTLFSKKDKFRISEYNFSVVRCNNCGLLYVNPRPAEEEIVRFYPETYSWKETPEAVSFFGRLIKRLEKIYRDQLLDYEVNKVLSYTALRSGKVLDVGCGAGDRLEVFRRKGFDTYGVEISSAAGHAKEHLKLNVVEGDLFKAQYPGDFFDVITMHNVLEHVHSPRKLLQEISRVLKAKGCLIVQVPNIDSIQYRIFGKQWAAFDVPRDLSYFKPLLVTRLLENEGFQVLLVDHASSWWHPPTFTLSLFPGLDPQFFWQKSHPLWKTTCARICWVLVTVTIAPIFTFFERIIKRSAIVTVYARKR